MRFIYVMMLTCSAFLTASAEVFTITPTHIHLRGACDDENCLYMAKPLKSIFSSNNIAQLKESMLQELGNHEEQTLKLKNLRRKNKCGKGLSKKQAAAKCPKTMKSRIKAYKKGVKGGKRRRIKKPHPQMNGSAWKYFCYHYLKTESDCLIGAEGRCRWDDNNNICKYM